MSQDEAGRSPGPRPLFSGGVVWSGVLSLIVPGLGQVHARSWRRGVNLLGATVAGGVAARSLTLSRPEPATVLAFLALALAYVLLALWAGVDAIRCARRTLQPIKPRWFRSTWFAFLAMTVVSGAVDVALPLGWRNFSIPAGSMIPALLVGDYVVVGVQRTKTLPERGEIFVFEYPRDRSIDYIKRIVGLPGDHVQMKQGLLYINGQVCPREPLGDYETNDRGYSQRVRLFLETRRTACATRSCR